MTKLLGHGGWRTGAASLAALALAAGLLGTAPSCGSDEPGAGGMTGSSTHSSTASSSSSSSGTSSSSSASSSSSTSSSGKPVCDPQPLPEGIPDGWEEYTDWSCQCRFYVPASKEALPPPIVWEPCPESPNGIDCRQMKVDWPYLYTTPIAFNNFLDWSPGSPPVLAFRRLATAAPHPYWTEMVAEVDGPTRNALIHRIVPGQPSSNPGCYTGINSMAEGKWVISARGHDAYGSSSDSLDKGMIGGPIDQLNPPVLAHTVDDQAYTWFVSAKWVGYINAPATKIEIAPWPWAGQPVTFVSSAAVDPEHLTLGNPVLRSDAVFWEASSLLQGGINVWTVDKGSRPFIRWLNDFTRMAGGFGTDGVDMVWSYGEKQSPNDPEFVGSIMTAPFTTDPDAVQSRRLRSFTSQIGNFAWSVGCGYAANSWWNDTIVVRL